MYIFTIHNNSSYDLHQDEYKHSILMTNISRHSRHENLKNCNFSITVEIMSSPTEGIHLYNTANWSFSNWTLKTFFITQVTNIKICHMEQ